MEQLYTKNQIKGIIDRAIAKYIHCCFNEKKDDEYCASAYRFAIAIDNTFDILDEIYTRAGKNEYSAKKAREEYEKDSLVCIGMIIDRYMKEIGDKPSMGQIKEMRDLRAKAEALGMLDKD